LREYETVFLLHPSLEEKDVEAEIQAVCDLITSTGGKIEDVERWGRRRLAYEIQKVHDGFYTLVRFSSESQTLNDLNRRYRLNEKLLRHLTVRSEGPVAPPPPPRPEGERGEGHRERRDDGEFELPRLRSSGYGAPPAHAAVESPERAEPNRTDRSETIG
jgi:small subunit ribosomal protein S6